MQAWYVENHRVAWSSFGTIASGATNYTVLHPALSISENAHLSHGGASFVFAGS